jgi:hypothetical protein
MVRYLCRSLQHGALGVRKGPCSWHPEQRSQHGYAELRGGSSAVLGILQGVKP